MRALFAVLATGCATSASVKQELAPLNDKLTALEQKQAATDAKLADLNKKADAQAADIQALRKEIATETLQTRILAGSLELSNVDLAQELAELIIAQRGFQANARTVTTTDEILQETDAVRGRFWAAFDAYMDVKLYLEKLLGRRVDLVLADAGGANLHIRFAIGQQPALREVFDERAVALVIHRRDDVPHARDAGERFRAVDVPGDFAEDGEEGVHGHEAHAALDEPPREQAALAEARQAVALADGERLLREVEGFAGLLAGHYAVGGGEVAVHQLG